MRLLLVAVLALAVTACASGRTIGIVDAPRLSPPSQAVLSACSLPTALPAGEMTQRDIERYWGLDRKHQIECAKKHGILVEFITARDAGLSGKK